MATKPLSEILIAKRGVEDKLLSQPGVTGVDVGYKYVGGERTDDLAIRVMVEKKKTSVPNDQKIPPEIEGVSTDVIERKFFLHAPRNQKPVEELDLQADSGTYNPVKGGVSIGPVRAIAGVVWAGTLGLIVRDNKTSAPLLLSNFHVMAVDEDGKSGDAIAQPSLVDGGRDPTSVVGSLQRVALTGTVDAAVASLQARNYSNEIADIGPTTGTNTAAPGMAVRKRGRTTGLTYGIIDGVSLSITLPYPGDIGLKTLTNQIDVRPDPAHNAAFADHGDSGAALVDENGKVVGLHFAGSDDGHGVANPIAEVLAALDVSIVTDSNKVALKDNLSDGKSAQVKEIKIEKEAKAELFEKQKAEFLEKQKEKNEKFETKDFKDTEFFTPKASQLVEGGGPPMSAKSDDPSTQKGSGTAEGGSSGSSSGSAGSSSSSSSGGGSGSKTPDTPPKDWQKDFKDTLKEVKDKDKDKESIKDVIPDKDINKDIVDFGGGSLSGASAAAKPPIEGKTPDKPGVEKPVKSDKEKIEIKENKPEAKETKVEFKEHKNEAKDLKNEAKEHKSEAKEHIKDFKEKNDAKEHKIENKELKIELKDHKSEFEKPFRENVKDLVEGQKFAEAGDPIQTGIAAGGLQGANAPSAALKIADKIKDFIDKRIEKFHKDFDKTHKDFDKTHKDKDFEKLIFEGGGKQIVEGGDPFQVAQQGLQGASAPAALKHIDKFKDLVDKTHKDFDKTHKDFDKTHKDKDFEKLIFEGGGKQVVEGGDPFQVAQQGLQGASAPAALKHIDKFKDLVDKTHKDFDKTHKDVDKTHKDKDFEKLIFEGGGKQIVEGGDPFQIAQQGLQGASAPAALKQVDKLIDKNNNLKPEGKIEFKDHKNENKEFKVEKLEGKDGKIEHKDHKTEIKELKGEKDFKIENKEHGKIEIIENQKLVFEGGGKINEGGDPFQIGQAVNPALQAVSVPVGLKHADKVGREKIAIKDKIEIKDFKIELKEHKNEFKDQKNEKQEFKVEVKDFKSEFEKLFPENPKQLVEGGPKLAEGGDPVRPGTPAPGLQGASEPTGDSKKEDGKKEGGAGTQAAAGAAAAAKFPKLEFEKHPKFEIEKLKFEGEKIKFEGEKIKFENEKTKFEKEFLVDKQKNEFEKIFQESPKTIAEGPGPVIPNQPDPASRIAQLEAAVAQFSTFIPQHLRPDLGSGALTNEPDQKPAQPAAAKPDTKSEKKPEAKSEPKSDPKGKKS
ncbi:MAG: hypothetical protein WDO17_16145 [Alphaproteobacteria bacterium]